MERLRPDRRLMAADIGVSTGLVLYCIFEFGSTGSFGFQRGIYTSRAEQDAAIVLGIVAGFVAWGWFAASPISRFLGARTAPQPEVSVSTPDEPTGLRGGPPSSRHLLFLLLGEMHGFVVAAFVVPFLAFLVLLVVARVAPTAVDLIAPGALLAYAAFIWSRIARLRRLCRIGAETEGWLTGVTSDEDLGRTAKYAYEFGGERFEIENSSWWWRRLALRHGERVIVLVDPRRPADAAILGPTPSSP